MTPTRTPPTGPPPSAGVLAKHAQAYARKAGVSEGRVRNWISHMVRHAGAKEIHLRISSPPTTGPCHYGIDTPKR